MPHKSSEVSDMFDIEPRTLFVYESENLIAPERTPPSAGATRGATSSASA